MANSSGWTLERVRKVASGTCFVLSLFVTALIGFISLSFFYLPGFLLKLSFAQWIYDTLTSLWFTFAVGLFEIIHGVKIVVNGDVKSLNKNRCALIIMNHRTRLDWLFFFAVQLRYGSLRRFKIALKEEIRHLPGPGWAMQGAQFLFLKRRWEIDRERITTSLKSFKSNGLIPQILFFPEGTDFRAVSREKSRRYAEKNDLVDYEYVLHPRTLGFTTMVNEMRKYNDLEQIIDVTVSYPHNMVQSELDVMKGNIPKKIVFTLKTYEVDQLQTDSDHRLTAWVEERWAEKEEFLRQCYRNGTFSGSNNYTHAQNAEIERDSKIYMVGALIFWTLWTCLVIYMSIMSYSIRLTMYMLGCVYFAISGFVGIDAFFTKIRE
ncbi:Lysocardiolipin acyltransferase 1 [Mactra antiquata]